MKKGRRREPVAEPPLVGDDFEEVEEAICFQPTGLATSTTRSSTG